MTKAVEGQSVKVHYVGTFDDGTEFDSSLKRGEPIEFVLGSGQMIEGFDNAVVGMKVGDSKNITLTPDQAYGDSKPEAVQVYPKGAFPEDLSLVEGASVSGQNELGQTMIAKIVSLDDETVTLDFNHPMAGKNLNFSLELISLD